MLPGVCNSVVFIQSGGSNDHNRVTSANCSKAGSKINHPQISLITLYSLYVCIVYMLPFILVYHVQYSNINIVSNLIKLLKAS